MGCSQNGVEEIGGRAEVFQLLIGPCQYRMHCQSHRWWLEPLHASVGAADGYWQAGRLESARSEQDHPELFGDCSHAVICGNRLHRGLSLNLEGAPFTFQPRDNYGKVSPMRNHQAQRSHVANR